MKTRQTTVRRSKYFVPAYVTAGAANNCIIRPSELFCLTQIVDHNTVRNFFNPS